MQPIPAPQVPVCTTSYGLVMSRYFLNICSIPQSKNKIHGRNLPISGPEERKKQEIENE